MEEIKTIGGYQLPRGADGGHYTPVVAQTSTDTMTVEFQPSKTGMAAVEPVEIKLPVGDGDGSGQNPAQGGGMSAAAAGLLIKILRVLAAFAPITPDVDALEVLLTAGSAETPEQGVTENGSVLTIISGVTVEENGDTLIIK